MKEKQWKENEIGCYRRKTFSFLLEIREWQFSKLCQNRHYTNGALLTMSFKLLVNEWITKLDISLTMSFIKTVHQLDFPFWIRKIVFVAVSHQKRERSLIQRKRACVSAHRNMETERLHEKCALWIIPSSNPNLSVVPVRCGKTNRKHGTWKWNSDIENSGISEFTIFN